MGLRLTGASLVFESISVFGVVRSILSSAIELIVHKLIDIVLTIGINTVSELSFNRIRSQDIDNSLFGFIYIMLLLAKKNSHKPYVLAIIFWHLVCSVG